MLSGESIPSRRPSKMACVAICIALSEKTLEQRAEDDSQPVTASQIRAARDAALIRTSRLGDPARSGACLRGLRVARRSPAENSTIPSACWPRATHDRSEEHTSELQS